MSNRVRLALRIIGLVGALSLLNVSAAVLVFTTEYRGVIVPGVRVEGVDVGGLDRQEAIRLVRQRIPQPSPDSALVFADSEGQTWSFYYGSVDYYHDYAATIDRALRIGKQVRGMEDVRALFKVALGGTTLELETVFSRDAVRTLLERIKAESAIPPTDTQIAYDSGAVTLLPGTPGRELDLEATMERIEESRLRDHRVLLVFREIEPALSLESLKYLNTRLGFYATSFNPGDRGRTHNLRTVCDLLNNHIVHPGEIFSLNAVLGPRTPENGYALAPVFVGGRIVLDYGGGVCQVASTLYNAVLDAELPVVERHGHSRFVSYVPPGRDATIVTDVIDFKFQNNRRYPLLISSRVEADKLLVAIYGHSSDAHNVIYRTETEREVIQHRTVFRVDPTLESGEIRILVPGREGYEITTYQVTVVDNEVVQREIISKRRVEPQDAVVLVAPTDGSCYGISK